MIENLLIEIFIGIMVASAPLIFAAIGALLVERSGVLNLGVEGMMIVGALLGFVVISHTNNAYLAVLAALVAGMVIASIFAFLTQFLLTNQVATGLALTLFGLGFAAFAGREYTEVTIDLIGPIYIPILSEIPYIGPSLFSLNPLIYLAFFMVYIVWWFLFKTKQGLILRAIGDNHDAAHAIGHNVVLYRFMAILFGGAMAGLGGAFLSLVQVPIWGEGMTAGRGWIAIGLVVFASWQPFRVILGAVLFGGITVLQLHAQGFDIRISAQYLSMLPYLATIVILVSLRMRLKNKTNRTVPNCLGRIFHSTT
ncbi:ABC transporter permease [Candidatus Pseudothioglobus singularis]|jgi:simple sugar transport system permease protein|uniref:ABC transporter permease n=1 Tax=Candidatus Pseudothioglobus singularis PS1 TaxID=1125411 RepID=A0A0M4L5M0_9GAMM|nr:ABC transporter permease [Candidatus Pseudothioglobus singularis]ALE02013.1 ABC transporter permease [Candidatus Pseudothioglobus singularis PS1]MDA8813592.1 ABC transporter permease [Candidatus Pseudothioglobus singularis]MDA9030285.1 ABC transporter permease [Candidatus Pseudothioglobus singularis]MDB2670546.1 ABC transporter permease [Candidatus Pseudothioglobus singularis]MDC0471048.1 ABC transporter permease [Candidatus Pseudothioglobus singularis]